MMTREEALRRLDAVTHDLVALRTALAEGWIERPVEDPTQVFLAKCWGWEDTRSPEEIIAEIYAARTVSQRGTSLLPQMSPLQSSSVDSRPFCAARAD